MNNIDIKKLGFNEKFANEANSYNNLYVGRVFSQSTNLYKVMSKEGELTAEISGKFRFETKSLSDFPAVGDFVMIDRTTSETGNAIIHHVFTRKSVFIRKAAGKSNEEQVVASNIDTVFICMALNNDFNLRRLERYLAVGWDSGATPVVVLTKSDLCEDIEQKLNEVNSVCIGADIIITSSLEKNSYLELMKYIEESKTAAFIGSSGVGKSTLINCLIGEDKLETNTLRNDDKGRHTTTRRELIVLSNGGMVIDTPGMRELGLETADLSKTFSDIDELASGCKFNDCTHTSEPGCAVQKAIKDGIISSQRLLSYKKLQKETLYQGLNSRQIEDMKIKEMFSSFGGMKNARKYIKSKSRR